MPKYEPHLESIDIAIENTEPGILPSFTMSCGLRPTRLVLR